MAETSLSKVHKPSLFLILIIIAFVAILLPIITIYAPKVIHPKEVSHYIIYDNREYYFGNYYINNEGEIVIDTYWTPSLFLTWTKTEETIRIPVSSQIKELK